MAMHMIVYITIAIVVRVIDYPKIVGRHGSVVVCTIRLLRIVTRDLYVLGRPSPSSPLREQTRQSITFMLNYLP